MEVWVSTFCHNGGLYSHHHHRRRSLISSYCSKSLLRVSLQALQFHPSAAGAMKWSTGLIAARLQLFHLPRQILHCVHPTRMKDYRTAENDAGEYQQRMQRQLTQPSITEHGLELGPEPLESNLGQPPSHSFKSSLKMPKARRKRCHAVHGENGSIS